MTVADSITHLSTVSLAATATAQKGAGPAAILFKSATVTHYGPDGVQPATKGTMSFAAVQVGADGSITGGQITHTVTTPEGQPVHESTLQLAAGGKVAQAQTTIHNHNDAGVANVLAADLSGVQWTDSGKIQTGTINLKSAHPVTGVQTAAGTMVFQNEKLVSGTVTHYSAQDPKAVESLTEMDYSGVNFLGTKVAGGQLKVTRKQPDQTVSSTSQVSFQPDASGRVANIQTTNMDPKSGGVKSQVATDYSNVTYDARNVVTAGDVHIQVTAPDKTPISHAVVTFANSVPQSAQTWRFDGNTQLARVMTDYSGAQFDNHNRVVGGAIKVNVYDASDNPLATSNVTYDGKGAVANKQTQKVPPSTAPAAPKALQDVAKVWTNLPPKPAPAPLPIKQVTAPPPTAKSTYRKDGTLEESVETASANGVPVSAVVTHYDTDGKTVASTYNVDLTKVSMAGGKASGAVAVAESIAGTRKSSDSVFSY
jgi:hypothetical protein